MLDIIDVPTAKRLNYKSDTGICSQMDGHIMRKHGKRVISTAISSQKESHHLFYQQNFFNFLNQRLECNLIALLLYFCIELLKRTNDVSRNIEMKIF